MGSTKIPTFAKRIEMLLFELQNTLSVYYSYLSKFDEIFTVNFTRRRTCDDKQQLKKKRQGVCSS